MFPKEVELTDRHRRVIYTCIGHAKGKWHLASKCDFDDGLLDRLEPIPNYPFSPTLPWRVWAAIVDYARHNDIVGAFFDVITAKEPYADNNINIQNALSILCCLPDSQMKSIYEMITTAYWRHITDGYPGSDSESHHDGDEMPLFPLPKY